MFRYFVDLFRAIYYFLRTSQTFVYFFYYFRCFLKFLDLSQCSNDFSKGRGFNRFALVHLEWKILTLRPQFQLRRGLLMLLVERLGFVLHFLQRGRFFSLHSQRLCYITRFNGFAIHMNESTNKACPIPLKKLGSRASRQSSPWLQEGRGALRQQKSVKYNVTATDNIYPSAKLVVSVRVRREA